MNEGDGDQGWQRHWLGVNESLEIAQQEWHLRGRRRDEYGIAWPVATDPVGNAAQRRAPSRQEPLYLRMCQKRLPFKAFF
jgi:hypothetical protein